MEAEPAAGHLRRAGGSDLVGRTERRGDSSAKGDLAAVSLLRQAPVPRSLPRNIVPIPRSPGESNRLVSLSLEAELAWSLEERS